MKTKAGSYVTSRILNVSLFQAVIYAGLWLWDEYVASYITIIFPALLLVILVLAYIVDWIEPSRIPRWYYLLMIVSIFIPLIIGAIFFYLYEGRLDWLRN